MKTPFQTATGPVFGLHVVDIENRVVVGELIFENARLDIGRQLRRRHCC